MKLGIRRSLVRFGLGLAAGALLYAFPHRSRAQVVPPPASEIPVPPKPETDTGTVKRDTVRTDTIKAPIGRAPVPAAAPITGTYRWTRDEILASGAYTLTDLLHRVPELTTFRSGWLASPQVASLAGDFLRLRLFLDGVELDPIDPRERGIHDLAHVPIWSLDDVVIERAAGEVRIHLRTWSVERTTPYTRTDVYTGNEETDIYRGYYGKRFFNGTALQLAAEQSGTENVRLGGGGDALSLFGRAGIGKRSWSFDAFVQRTHYNRARQLGIGVPTLTSYDATHTVGYLRAAIGRHDRGPWLELIAATHGVKEGSPRVGVTEAASLGVPADTVDTTTSRAQYIVSGGYRVRRAAFTVTNRYRRLAQGSENSLGARMDVDTRFLSASASVEDDGARNLRIVDGQVRVSPLPFLALSAASSHHKTSGLRTASVRPNEPRYAEGRTVRGEAALRVFGVWAYGGGLHVNGSTEPGPVTFDTAYRRDPSGSRAAVFGGLRGVGWRGIGTDSYVIRWDLGAPYVPEYQARAELNVRTEWRQRFPRGEFNFKFAVADDFRSSVIFPTGTGFRRAGASHVLSGLMEIRIMRATLTFQTRNPLGKSYFIVPGFEMPRAVSTYGVRWFFWG